MQQFQRWFDEAINAKLPEPNAMTLATVDADGQPSARIVLLKGLDQQGFTFFTNYESRKGRTSPSTRARPLLFHWCNWSARCAWKAASRRSPRPKAMPITPPGRWVRAWEPGRPSKAGK